MDKKQHNEKAQELLKEANINDINTEGWYLHWDGKAPPQIFDKHDNLICTMCTGTIDYGEYDTDSLFQIIKRIIEGNRIINDFLDYLQQNKTLSDDILEEIEQLRKSGRQMSDLKRIGTLIDSYESLKNKRKEIESILFP